MINIRSSDIDYQTALTDETPHIILSVFSHSVCDKLFFIVPYPSIVCTALSSSFSTLDAGIYSRPVAVYDQFTKARVVSEIQLQGSLHGLPLPAGCSEICEMTMHD